MATFQYNEPTFPIYKQEMFDEDNLKQLLVDDNFNKQDRIKLSNYNKHRISGSKINVSYKFGLGCEDLKLGRLFPDESIGLQSFRFDMRNPLAKKFYWDTDIENCHYVIALYQCKKYNESPYKCSNLRQGKYIYRSHANNSNFKLFENTCF
jgi:hypothetical protein